MRTLISHAIDIARKPEEVFAVASDPASQLKWQPERLRGLEALTGSPPRKGARYRGNYKGMGWMEFEFAEFEPPRRFVHKSRVMGTDLYHVWELRPNNGGTTLEQQMSGEPRGLFRLILPLMRGSMKKQLASINEALKRHLES
jgi:uncharacterized protein YndB with AHSA1/START domain